MSDTIAAISTATGEGGVGIVRVSGPNCLNIMRSVFDACPEEVVPRHAYYGHAVDREGRTIDEVICLYMKAPHTYTCEDVLELQAHGSRVSLKLILRSVLAAGARSAEPGEFTKRAFLNGRMDLTQAEAVIDLIKAKSEMPLSIAGDQLAGRLGEEVNAIRSALLDTLAQMAVNIDFPDEDIEQETLSRFAEELAGTRENLLQLLRTSEGGRIAREGIKIAIVGKPNVGKSSLMNAILGEKRVIVTDIPGTTRDTVEEAAQIAGIPVVLVDTAGIRETDDVIEQIGISRSQEELSRADLVVMVFDASRALGQEDREIAGKLQEKNILAVCNKADLKQEVTEKEIAALLPPCEVVTTSLLTTKGADEVMAKIESVFTARQVRSSYGNVVTGERQRDALERADGALSGAIRLLQEEEPLEIAELEVHSAYDALGEITGETAGEEILDAVFSRFCLGK